MGPSARNTSAASSGPSYDRYNSNSSSGNGYGNSTSAGWDPYGSNQGSRPSQQSQQQQQQPQGTTITLANQWDSNSTLAAGTESKREICANGNKRTSCIFLKMLQFKVKWHFA